MALADVDLIALMRSLWGVTTTQAPDVWAEAWVPRLRELVDVDVFGDTYDDALAALLAHHARALDPAGAYGGASPSGPVTAISTLGMSVSYAAPPAAVSTADASYQTTAPGRHFIRVRDSRELSWLPLVVG